MMSQQIIVDIHDKYPFWPIEQPAHNLKILVRKIINYSSHETYSIIKQKVELLKHLKQAVLVKLINVLEGEGQFHLIYEYIEYKYEDQSPFLSREQYLAHHKKMVQMSYILYENYIVTQIEDKHMGLDKNNAIKYYLDIQNFKLKEDHDLTLKKSYLNQINIIFEINDPQLDKATEYKSHNNKKNNSRLNACKSRKSSMQDSKQKQKISSLEALNKIDEKLNKLKSSTKKFDPNMRQTFKLKQTLRQTVKQNWTKQRMDVRKMSGQTTYQSSVLKNRLTPPKPKMQKTLQKIQCKQKDVMFQKQKQMPEIILQQILIKKEPLSKKDFQEMKKNEFQNFFKSKEKYVHQFLGLLDDEPGTATKQTILIHQQNKTTQNHFQLTNVYRKCSQYTSPDRYKVSAQKDNNKKKSPGKSETSPSRGPSPKNIKQRIDSAIKKSDIAMEKFRKQSTYTIQTQNIHRRY